MIKNLLITALLLMPYALRASDCPLKFYSDSVSSVGIVVYDLQEEREVFNCNGAKSLIPASTMKLVTSAAALSLYPYDYQYETPAYIYGIIKDGTLYGDLIIKGSGDPTLYSRHFPDNQTFIEDIVSSLKGMGVKRIAGNMSVDLGDAANQGKLGTWEIEDGYYEYGTGWYSFNHRDNVFWYNPTTYETRPSSVIFDEMVNTVDGKLYLNQSFGASYNEIDDTEEFSEDTSLKLPNPRPNDLFISELCECMADSSIVFIYDEEIDNQEMEMDTDSIPVASYYSPALKAILKDLMSRSDNMMAESTLRLLAPGKSIKEALKVEKEFYESKGISTDMYTIKDGSGLSRSNGISPAFLVQVLKMMSKNEDFIDIFPRAGMDGTLKNTFKGSVLEGRAALKSGSMGAVRCYAGYLLDDDDNPRYAVAVMINNFKCKLPELHKQIELFLSKYYE